MVHDEEWVPLFNGRDLDGWHPIRRSYGPMWPGGPTLPEMMPGWIPDDYDEQAEAHKAVWSVEDGAIVGRQASPGAGYGGYLLTDEQYGDFELRFEVKPDFPADTGVHLRQLEPTFAGIHVVVDHRDFGSIGGFWGSGIGAFHAIAFSLRGRRDADGTVVGFDIDDPATSVQPWDESKAALLTHGTSFERFEQLWRFGDWNEMRIRIAGIKPVVTTWLNGERFAEIDLGSMQAPNYDSDAVAALLGPRGHIGLEVHDNVPLGDEIGWGRDSAVRWRNLSIRVL